MLPQASSSTIAAIRRFFQLVVSISLLLMRVLSAPVPVGTVRAQGVESRPQPTPQESLLYRDARTLIDWTPDQIHAVPELRKLHPAESQQELHAILREVGERVARFFGDFPNTTCTEEVRSGPCPLGGDRCAVTFQEKFRYLVLSHGQDGSGLMTEYRTDMKGRPVDYQNLPNVRILTYGFATAPLEHFNPPNLTASRFRYFGRQTVDGRETDVVGFAEIPGEYGGPAEFGLKNHEVALLVQGLAWIDRTTYDILRIRTWLLAPRPDVGLEALVTLVEYAAVRLPEISTTFRLPATVIVTTVMVDVLHDRHQFRNVHRYSDYKLFRVESRISPVQEK